VNRLFSTILVSGLLLAVCNSTNAAVSYTAIDLGTLGGESSCASALNASGQIVGWSCVVAGTQHAFLYSDSTMRDLGTFGGASSHAYDINCCGQVVGDSNTADGSTHAFLYSGGTMNDLGTLGGANSFAYAINNRGQVVGASSAADGLYHAFLYCDGEMKDLGTLGGSSSMAQGINDSGQIVGWAETSAARHTFLYQNGEMRDIDVTGTIRTATGITNNGQIIGLSDESVFICKDGMIVDLKDPFRQSVSPNLSPSGIFPSTTVGITRAAANDDGYVVGSAYCFVPIDEYTAKLEFLAFLNIDGHFMNLNDLMAANDDWFFYDAFDINDSGQIVGFCEHNGHNCAYLLTPVPEPSCALLAAAGLMCCLFFVHRRRQAIFHPAVTR
jgi:probable HAF family extracellular repeat protein